VAAHGYFGRLIFQYASFKQQAEPAHSCSLWPVVGNLVHRPA